MSYNNTFFVFWVETKTENDLAYLFSLEMH